MSDLACTACRGPDSAARAQSSHAKQSRQATCKPTGPYQTQSTQATQAIDHAALARWLLHAADYGVTATHSTLRPGWPFDNVLSLSDGPAHNSTGRLLFYVATISVFAADVEADGRATLTVSEEQAPGGCRREDPEWPLCARVRC